MVFLTRNLFVRRHWHTSQFFGHETPSYDRFWEKRRIYQQAAHYFGRFRNTKLARRYFTRSLTYQTEGRSIRKRVRKELWDTRIEGSCQELDYNAWYMRDALTRAGVYLDRKVLANIALTEPRTFRAVTEIAATKSMDAPEDGGMGMKKCGPGIDVYSKL
eukprot:TRINITY_DN691_c0_g1_i2.p1 TRINITY_DN691_c0_g1~~TRINITY_DN691_c0_g1_i2.p1  ORF type:complete len:160 (-),score=27.90 TRINITY_DN691_c0_g1_i2:38-517(-)